jgi:hypothetical protein
LQPYGNGEGKQYVGLRVVVEGSVGVGYAVGFYKRYTCNKNDKFKNFQESQKSRIMNLKLFRIYVNIT